MTTLSPADTTMIHAYLDNQLNTDERIAFETRLAQEPELNAALETERQLRLNLRTRLKQRRAPASLRVSVQSALAETATPALPWWRQALGWFTTPHGVKPYIVVIYTFLVLIIAGSAATWFSLVPQPVDDHSSFTQLVGQHRAYLDNTGLLDVQGSPADVAAWFADFVPFAVTAPTVEGWTLEGGRLGEFHHRGAAHLVYDRAGQDVSLTLFIPRDTDFPQNAARHVENSTFYIGDTPQYTVILWRTDGVGYALIGPSSINTDELLSIARAFKTQLN